MNNVFGLSPKEAYSYLENKGLKTSFKYHEIKKKRTTKHLQQQAL
ncbi:hypothetical protein [Helicobacter winghamensis]